VPTLVLAMERSTPYSQRIAERVARCVPGSRLVVVPGATHFVSYQQPATFNEIVLRFLAEH
jgi:pimeloyl-ACP methyl ester carboxylesterase